MSGAVWKNQEAREFPGNGENEICLDRNAFPPLTSSRRLPSGPRQPRGLGLQSRDLLLL